MYTFIYFFQYNIFDTVPIKYIMQVLCTFQIFLILGGKILLFNKTFQLLKAYFIHFNNTFIIKGVF